MYCIASIIWSCGAFLCRSTNECTVVSRRTHSKTTHMYTHTHTSFVLIEYSRFVCVSSFQNGVLKCRTPHSNSYYSINVPIIIIIIIIIRYYYSSQTKYLLCIMKMVKIRRGMLIWLSVLFKTYYYYYLYCYFTHIFGRCGISNDQQFCCLLPIANVRNIMIEPKEWHLAYNMTNGWWHA